jgi:hypothetical protein
MRTTRKIVHLGWRAALALVGAVGTLAGCSDSAWTLQLLKGPGNRPFVHLCNSRGVAAGAPRRLQSMA